jgi:hypothetical protein
MSKLVLITLFIISILGCKSQPATEEVIQVDTIQKGSCFVNFSKSQSPLPVGDLKRSFFVDNCIDFVNPTDLSSYFIYIKKDKSGKRFSYYAKSFDNITLVGKNEYLPNTKVYFIRESISSDTGYNYNYKSYAQLVPMEKISDLKSYVDSVILNRDTSYFNNDYLNNSQLYYYNGESYYHLDKMFFPENIIMKIDSFFMHERMFLMLNDKSIEQTNLKLSALKGANVR